MSRSVVESCRFDETVARPQLGVVKRFEARLRMVEGELVLLGDVAGRSLEICEAQGGEVRRIGKLTLQNPEELEALFQRLSSSEQAPPSTPGPIEPFQPPPDEA